MESTYVILSSNSRYFDAKDFSKQGFQSPFAEGYEMILLKSDVLVQKTYLIEQTEINFYDFMWLDTSAISVIEFGQKLFNYRV